MFLACGNARLTLPARNLDVPDGLMKKGPRALFLLPSRLLPAKWNRRTD